MQKGFLHVVEIVIVSLMAFLVLLQFSYVPKQNIDWNGMKLSIQANDILFSLDRKGVDWFNSTQVDSTISSFLSNNTIYSLKIRNAMKPKISVGCICSAAEITALRDALKPFEINGHPVSFTVAQVSPVAFSHEYDVIVINDSDMTAHYDQIRQFLAADKGVVKIQDVKNPTTDAVLHDFFNIEWDNTVPAPSGNIYFRSNVSSWPYYNIYKYFHNIPIYQENFTSGATGWNTQIGSWNVNSQNYLGDSGANPEAVAFYSTQFQDSYSMRTWLKFDTAANAKMIVYRQDADDYVAVDFNRVADSVTVYNNVSGTPSSRGSASCPLGATSWYDIKIIPQPDSRLKIYLNNSLILTSQPVNTLPNSQIGLGVAAGQARFDNVRVTFADKHTFPEILDANEQIRPYDNNYKKVILNDSGGVSACIVNDNIADDRGRAAWMTNDGFAANQDLMNMLRTLVVWAAGEENNVVKNDVRHVPVVTSLYRVYDQDMYQPVEIVLTMGNLYG